MRPHTFINNTFCTANLARNKFKISALTGLSILCLGPICALAGEITVNDCNGITRAQIALTDQNERKDLTIGIEDNLTQTTKVLLKSDSTVTSSEVTNGQAYFYNLNSGVYELCPESGSAQLSTVKFSTAEQGIFGSTGVVALGAAAVGGSIIAIGSAGGNSSNNDSASTGAVLSQNTGSNSLPARKPPSAAASSSQADRDCLNGATVNPISPFQ